MGGDFILSDQFLVELAGKSLVPFATLMLVMGYGLGSLIATVAGAWSFNKLAIGNRSLRPEERSQYFWGGVVGLIVGGFLFGGLTTIDLVGRTVVVSEFRALSYNGTKFTGLGEKTATGFVYGTAYFVGAWLILIALISGWCATQDRNVKVGRVLTLILIGGMMVQSKELSIRAQNTLKSNISSTNSDN